MHNGSEDTLASHVPIHPHTSCCLASSLLFTLSVPRWRPQICRPPLISPGAVEGVSCRQRRRVPAACVMKSIHSTCISACFPFPCHLLRLTCRLVTLTGPAGFLPFQPSISTPTGSRCIIFPFPASRLCRVTPPRCRRVRATAR